MINILFYQIIAFTRHGKISKSHPKEINLKKSASAWNNKLELPDGSYYVSKIRD